MDFDEEIDAELSSDDEDYVPTKQMIESSDDEDDDDLNDDQDESELSRVKKTSETRKSTAGIGKKQAKPEVPLKSAEEEKKRIDDMWSDFLRDTNTETAANESKSEKVQSKSSGHKNEIETEKPSAQSEITSKSSDESSSSLFENRVAAPDTEKEQLATDSRSKETPVQKPLGLGKRPKGDLSSLLGQFSKKQKPTLLESTRNDWNSFKDKEGINEELKTFNRGKDGYIDRKTFLNDVDLRLFEKEKEVRSKARKH